MRDDHPTLMVGTVLEAHHRGETYRATVVESSGEGFVAEFDGMRYTSLSAMGKAVTGGSVNGWRFWHIIEGGAAAIGSAIKPKHGGQAEAPSTVDDEPEIVMPAVEDLPDEYRAREGYVPMEKDERGNYSVKNPKLGKAPKWIAEASDRWTGQCDRCCLLVVIVTKQQGFFDDYEGEIPHACTHRYPGESVEVAQDRLTHLYIAHQEAKRRAAIFATREEALKEARR